jgi:hypothetical protein
VCPSRSPFFNRLLAAAPSRSGNPPSAAARAARAVPERLEGPGGARPLGAVGHFASGGRPRGCFGADAAASPFRGRLPAVWLHAPARSAWAALHVVRRHGGRVENVVILEIDVPRSWLRRNRKGIWYTRRDVPPGRFRRVIDFIEVAGPAAGSDTAA